MHASPVFPPANDDAVRRTEELSRGEQLVLWSLRAVALGHGECPALRRAFHLALGSTAEEAFAALFLAVRLIGWGGRRRLRLHVPGCACVSADEADLIALFGQVARATADGDERALQAALGALVEARLFPCLMASLQTVACALEVGGYPLEPAIDPRARRARLH